MTESASIRHSAGSTLIGQDDYAQPSRFDAIDPSAMKRNDLIIPGPNSPVFELDDERPLTSRVFVAPLRAGNAQVAIIDDDPNAQAGQTAVVVPATNLSGCQDVTFQVQFFTRPGGWPQVSTIAVLNLERAPD